MSRFVALLRGINVGGKNIIRMTDLRSCFESLGYADVDTYIQSGNVVFTASSTSPARLTSAIETSLSDRFRYNSRVCVVSAASLQRIVAEAPDGFGGDPDRYRYDVIFLLTPITCREVMAQVTARSGVDTVAQGGSALYFRRLSSKAAQSQLNKLIQQPVYKHVTIRNWNTTTKLLDMVSDAEAPKKRTKASSNPTRKNT